MKKILALLMISACFAQGVSAQNSDIKRPASIGFSFVLNDYVTAERIRTGSVSSVLRDKSWGDFHEGIPGIAVSYFQGLHPKIDLAVTLSGAFANLRLPNRNRANGDQFLTEVDASAQFKMFPENFTVIPYLSGGIGASYYNDKVGAILPLGLGLRFNIFGESSIYINTQYRVPLIAEANAYHFYHSIGITGLLSPKKAAGTPAQ